MPVRGNRGNEDWMAVSSPHAPDMAVVTAPVPPLA
jgi:hypothetical protein